MELETIARYKLPITVVIINNNGITFGYPKEVDDVLEGDRAIGIPVNGKFGCILNSTIFHFRFDARMPL
jgi:hypothetical protein